MLINVAYFDKNLNLPYIIIKAKRVYFDLTTEAREKYIEMKQ